MTTTNNIQQYYDVIELIDINRDIYYKCLGIISNIQSIYNSSTYTILKYKNTYEIRFRLKDTYFSNRYINTKLIKYYNVVCYGDNELCLNIEV